MLAPAGDCKTASVRALHQIDLPLELVGSAVAPLMLRGTAHPGLVTRQK